MSSGQGWHENININDIRYIPTIYRPILTFIVHAYLTQTAQVPELGFVYSAPADADGGLYVSADTV